MSFANQRILGLDRVVEEILNFKEVPNDRRVSWVATKSTKEIKGQQLGEIVEEHS